MGTLGDYWIEPTVSSEERAVFSKTNYPIYNVKNKKKPKRVCSAPYPCVVYLTQETDGADDLLNAEKRHLLKMKKSLESHLRAVQKQLQLLDNARKRLKVIFVVLLSTIVTPFLRHFHF